MKQIDIAIIGSGILGTFHAYWALQKGLRVKMFEKNDEPRSATVRNFGQIVPSGMDSKWQQYGRITLETLQQINEQHKLSITQKGSIYIASNEEEEVLIKELAEINTKNNYSSEVISDKECIDLIPGLRDDYVQSAIFFPEELSVNPKQLIFELHQYLKTFENFSIEYNTLIHKTSSEFSEVKIYSASGKSFAAHKAIICSGADCSLLYPDYFKKQQLQKVKLQMVRLAPSFPTFSGNILTGLSIRRYESFSECKSYQKIKEKEVDNTFAKKWGVHILLKQEADGSIILGDSHEYADIQNEARLSYENRAEINQFFINEAKKIIRLTNWNIQSTWNGYYLQCKQQDILSEEIEENIFVVTGIGGKGMTGSAGYAKQNIEKITT